MKVFNTFQRYFLTENSQLKVNEALVFSAGDVKVGLLCGVVVLSGAAPDKDEQPPNPNFSGRGISLLNICIRIG